MSNTIIKNIPNAETLLVSLLEDLCYLYEYDEERSSIIFKKICNKLGNMGIVSKKSYSEDNKYTRKIFKKMLVQLIHNVKFDVIENMENDKKKLLTDQDSDSSINSPSELIKYVKDNKLTSSTLTNSTMTKMIKNYSRVHQDFIELEKIGKGGFGHVFKMYHKIDSMLYALKKIPLNNSDLQNNSFDKILHEVRCIAKLNHPNIIRYYNSWVEYNIFPEKKMIDSNSSNSVIIDEDQESYDFDYLDFEEEEEEETNNQLKLTLFIQMELCDLNLKQWLEKRDEYDMFDYQHSKEILKQLVSGINFIHKNDLIHRDIKPANIFLYNIYKDKNIPTGKEDEFNYIVKLADFGLSKEKMRKSNSYNKMMNLCNTVKLQKTLSYDSGIKNMLVKTDSENSLKDTSNLGTSNYASPEQLNSNNYNYKTDLFSLGIIIFELFHVNKTNMERYINLKNLRDKGILPLDFKFKQEKLLIKKLITKDPNLRINTEQILSEYLNN